MSPEASTALANLPLRTQFFGCTILFACPIEHVKKTSVQIQSQRARLIEKQLETIMFVVFYLNRACRAFIFVVIKNFGNEAFSVLMFFD